MSFIQKSDAVVINTKLTSAGRLLLSLGTLTFKKLEFGDSEIDYNIIRDNQTVLNGSDLSIMRPKDANPRIKYPIPVEPTVIDTKIPIVVNSLGYPVTNTAKQRGFFTGSTSLGFTALTSTTYIKGMTTAYISGVAGGTSLTTLSTPNVNANDMILIDWRNPKLLTFTSLTGEIGQNYPRQILWYKVQNVVGNVITVDRELPQFNSQGGQLQCVIYFYPANNAIDNYYSTGTTVGYWNYSTLAFDSTCNIGANDDVAVWNFNIVYSKTPEGVTNGYTAEYYDGAAFAGFKEYIQGASINNGKTKFGVIHFTNKSISNYYGEGFKDSTFSVTLPTIMYHGKSDATMGVVLSASTIKRNQPTTLTGFTTEYYDLIESTSSKIVGKVFNDLKIAVIEDEELLNVLALKSDRSHTLPPANFKIENAVSTDNPLVPTVASSKILHITYLFTNENTSSNGYNSTRSFGLRGGIHCGYVTKSFTNVNGKIATFQFLADDLKFMESDVSTSDGTGFNVNKFYILSQLVDDGDEPQPASWTIYDYTPKLLNYGTWSADTMPVAALTDKIYKFTYSEYSAATPYNVESYIGTLPTPANYDSTTQLGFGEESILLGNINTNIKAMVYRSKIFQNLGFNQYNTSNNPTFETGDDVYITEAGIYDDNNNLVAVGKLNTPIKKNNLKLFSLELDMDF
jgi:hypothetical protein